MCKFKKIKFPMHLKKYILTNNESAKKNSPTVRVETWHVECVFVAPFCLKREKNAKELFSIVWHSQIGNEDKEDP
jgi:hypothetical protein